MKNVLGLDLGTNSIGWAKVSMDDDGKYLHDIKLGSRIIPMSQDVISDFDKGKKVSQTALRRGFRGGAAPERTMFTTSGTLAPGVACAEFFT